MGGIECCELILDRVENTLFSRCEICDEIFLPGCDYRGSIRGRGSSTIRDVVGDGRVDLVPDGRDHRDLACPYRTCESLIVKCPEVFRRAAAATNDQRIEFRARIQTAIVIIQSDERPPDAVRRPFALNKCRSEHDADGTRTARD